MQILLVTMRKIIFITPKTLKLNFQYFSMLNSKKVTADHVLSIVKEAEYTKINSIVIMTEEMFFN